MPELPAQITFEDYLATVRAAEDRVKRLEGSLQRCAQDSLKLALVAALQVLRGIGFLSAVTIVAELGDFQRFASARQLMAYSGHISSQHSSGESCRRGGITHTRMAAQEVAAA